MLGTAWEDASGTDRKVKVSADRRYIISSRTVESRRGPWERGQSCLILGNPRQYWILDSLSLEFGFQIQVVR